MTQRHHVPEAAATGPFIQGASAEQGQQRHARARLAVGIAGQPVAQTRLGRPVRHTFADIKDPPQQFARRPRVINNPGPNEPVNQFMAHVPGRIPPAGWDGEPGGASPTAGWI